MKKYSFGFILLQNLIVILVSWLLAIGMSVLALNENILVSSLTNWLPITLFFMLLFYWLFIANPITALIAKKTMAKNMKKENFSKPVTLTNKDIGTVGIVLSVDEATGRIAYVSCQNPFAFQMAQPNELTDVVSSYKRGPMSTTRYVYFQFSYNGKRTRIPTYTTGNNVMVTSPAVRDGIAKADRLRNIILKFQKA
jgi:hypothetical protein